MNRSPYLSGAPSVSNIMLSVMFALVPGIIAYVWVFGGGVLVTLILATITALLAESTMLKLRGKPIKPFIFDLSAVVTAWLLALAIPPLTPWWLIVVGTLFAIVIAKQLYGGLGYNPFNPAMIGYAVLLISFPALMTQWPAPLFLAKIQLGFWEQANFILGGILPGEVKFDALTSATPLDYLKTQLKLHHDVASITQSTYYGHFGGKGVEWVASGYLLGGIYLMWKRIIPWQMPAAFLGALAMISGLFYLVNPAAYADPLLHLFSGASMLCAFFIITDPVSGPTTPRGRLIFSIGIALFVYLVRVFGGYPDGVAFAVIFFNICAPLIDMLTQPRVFGHEK